jgi:CPA1 family monovalent cation:H+ antiporter
VQLAASGAIFVLLGEQIPEILSGAFETVRQTGHQGPWWLALYVLALVSILALLRFAWVWTSLRVIWFRSQGVSEIRSKPGRRLVLLMSLAGVRGTVTLAGILTLPLALTDGSPFPARDLAIFLAAGVILVWLFTATLFLPPLLKRLDLPPEPVDEAAEDRLRRAAAEAAIQAIEAAQHSLAVGRADADFYANAATRIMEMYRLPIEASPNEAESTPLARQIESIERELRIAGLRAERQAIFQAGRSGDIDRSHNTQNGAGG